MAEQGIVVRNHSPTLLTTLALFIIGPPNFVEPMGTFGILRTELPQENECTTVVSQFDASWHSLRTNPSFHLYYFEVSNKGN